MRTLFREEFPGRVLYTIWGKRVRNLGILYKKSGHYFSRSYKKYPID
jgi:hypothetical protein